MGGWSVGRGHCKCFGLEGGPALERERKRGRQNSRPGSQLGRVYSQGGIYCPLVAGGATSAVKGSLPDCLGCGFNVRALA